MRGDENMLRRLRWARQIEDAKDPVLTSLEKKGLVLRTAKPVGPGKAEWRITAEGADKIVSQAAQEWAA